MAAVFYEENGAGTGLGVVRCFYFCNRAGGKSFQWHDRETGCGVSCG